MGMHLPAFVAGTLLSYLTDRLEMELEPGTFDGSDRCATFVARGEAGTRLRCTITVES